MDLGIVEKWQHSAQVELFYNSSQRKLVFKKYNYIYSKGVDDFHSYPYIDLQDYSAIFKTASFSLQDQILAFQRNDEDLVRYIQEFLIVESNLHFVHHGKNRKILGYHWIAGSAYADIVVIDNNSVEFFKLSSPSYKLSSVKSYQMNIGHYWYSSNEGILIASFSPPKLGHFSTFFVSQSKGPKLFNGLRFNLDLSPCVTDKWTNSPSNVTSLTEACGRYENNSPHTLNIVFLYGSSYLIHAQCLSGCVKVFKITYEKFEEIRKIQIPIGEYGIRAIDNLILVQNYTLQETYIIDIMSAEYAEKPFCTFWNNMQETCPVVSLKIKVFIQKPKIIAKPTFLYDKKPIQDLAMFKGSGSLGGEVIECVLPLDSQFVYTDNDICVDTKAGRCYKLQFSPLTVVENHPNRIECALFLFRRTGCKTQAYDFLKDCLRKSLHIREISNFFQTINLNYKNAIVEKKTTRKTVSKSDMYMRKLSTSLEPDLKIDEGMVVLFQSDMFSVLFQALFEENFVKHEYLSSILREYIHSLIDLDIDVQSSLQLLLARMLIKSGDLRSLQDLVEYSAFTDSYEMVNLLIQLIPSYYMAMQLSVDMLFRMRYHEKLIDIILEKDFIYETLCLLYKVSYPRFDIRKLLGKCEEIGDEQMTLVVTQFIKEKSLS